MTSAPTRLPTTTGTALPAVVATRITHTRVVPLRHSFTYRSSTWLADIDDLPRLRRPLRNLATFAPADHFPEPAGADGSLRDRLIEHLRRRGIDPPGGRVIALLSPRVAGHVFNPLSVFWCHDRDGSLRFVIAEVHNTYGERHCYVLHTDSRGRAATEKAFYVSPFNDVSGRYRIRVPEPGADGRVAVSVALDRGGSTVMTASLVGRARPATTPHILWTNLRTPVAPLLVSTRIRWQGIRLWVRGLAIVPRSRPSKGPA